MVVRLRFEYLSKINLARALMLILYSFSNPVVKKKLELLDSTQCQPDGIETEDGAFTLSHFSLEHPVVKKS